jgi:hypothetical protein
MDGGDSNDLRINLDSNGPLASMKKMFVSTLDEYKETCGMDKDALLGLAFWYTWGHMELHFWPLMESANLLYAVKRIIELLGSEQLNSVNPFTHHFTAFAAHILFQLSEFNDTREQALALLDSLDATLNNLIPHSDAQSFDAAIRDAVARKRNQMNDSRRSRSPTMGLDHLANAAVNNSNNGDVEETQDPPANDGGVAAAAEAAAKAVQLHMGSAAATAANKSFEAELVSQEGYLYALLG